MPNCHSCEASLRADTGNQSSDSAKLISKHNVKSDSGICSKTLKTGMTVLGKLKDLLENSQYRNDNSKRCV